MTWSARCRVAGARRLGAVAGCGALLVGCAVPVTGTPTAEVVVRDPVDVGFITNAVTDHADEVAAAAMTDINAYWTRTFPELGSQRFAPVETIVSVDPSDPAEQEVPCTGSPADVTDNAYFCPSAGAMVYDRTGLLPDLATRYGDAAVVIVLAHETGHSVHTQLGITPAVRQQLPQRYPTIVIESMADCYSGAFLRSVRDGRAPHLQVDAAQLDLAVGALVSFRDPVGTLAQDDGAHGNAFDRVSAFTTGYLGAPADCAAITVDNRNFSETAFTNADDAATGGNLPLDDLIGLVSAEVTTLYSSVTGRAETPELVRSQDGTCSTLQGPAAVCASPGGGRDVVADLPRLAAVHDEIGDYASATLLAARYMALALQNRPAGAPAIANEGLAAVCLAGVFTRAEADNLSPGDLDEAVQVLLGRYGVSRSAGGARGPDTGLDRVAAFRAGALQGVEACRIG